ncbi:MAG: vitamin K epoxide reductase family protein [Pirellulaceae bacterium]
MRIKLAVVRLFALIAMGVCMAMLLDYLLPSPAFCGFTAGCEEVTHSAYGRPLGVPLPLWGLGTFGMFYGLTLFPAGRPGKLIGPAALLAGLGGLSFIALQLLVIRRVCPLCMVIDASGLFIAACELFTTPAAVGVALPRRRRLLWATAALVALGVAPLWAAIKPARPVPETVQSLWTAGKITVVEVIDFDCPYCRLTHAALDELLADRKDRVQRVRFVLPLRAHANARPAARAYFAAVEQGKGEPMATALLAAEERSPATCERLASTLGLDMAAYQAELLISPETKMGPWWRWAAARPGCR